MSALGDTIVDALQELLRVLFSPVRSLIETHGDTVIRTVVGTPAPDAVFARPTNGPWPGLYDFYWETIIPLALLLWALSVALIIFLESTSVLFSGYHRAKLKRRAFSGLLGILAWWWVSAFALRLVGALGEFLVPSLADITLFETLSFSAMGALGVVLTLGADLLLFVLIAVIYFVREMALYLFVPLMPLLIAFWIPGVGPFAMVSGLMKRVAGFYVPFLFMTLPVAMLFRVGGVLGEGFSLSAGGFGAWLTALVIPILAVAAPLILFWQAGSVFSMTERLSKRVSAQQARGRGSGIHDTATSGGRGARNFARGVRGKDAVSAGGASASDRTRANRAGLRLRSRAQSVTGGLGGGSDATGDNGNDTEDRNGADGEQSTRTPRQRPSGTPTESRTSDRRDSSGTHTPDTRTETGENRDSTTDQSENEEADRRPDLFSTPAEREETTDSQDTDSERKL